MLHIIIRFSGVPNGSYVMQGLIELKELGSNIEPRIAGAYLSQCSLWMNQHELEIVEFSAPIILHLLFCRLCRLCYWIACCSLVCRENLKQVTQTPRNFFLDLNPFLHAKQGQRHALGGSG